MKNYLAIVKGISVGVLSSIALAGVAFSSSHDYGLGATAVEAGLAKNVEVEKIIGNIIGAGLSLITVLFFVLIIYAGIRWMLARGDSAEAKSALDTIVHATIGILIVVSAYAITQFVFNAAGKIGAPTSPPTVQEGSDTTPPNNFSCTPNTDNILAACEEEDIDGFGCDTVNGNENCVAVPNSNECQISNEYLEVLFQECNNITEEDECKNKDKCDWLWGLEPN